MYEHVLGMRVDCIEASPACDQIVNWAAEAPYASAPGRYVCAANVHMTMEAHDDPVFRAVVNSADLVVADGQPMVWALNAMHAPQARRVRVAPDLLMAVFAACEARGVRIGLYGGTPETLFVLQGFLAERFPRLSVPYAWSPPFRPLTADEDAATVKAIADAGVQLLLVGIGCPKQEKWMADHAGKATAGDPPIRCVMIGVGAAFDMLGGKTGNAPLWMQDRGLEWAYRLAQEPRRLWRRHLTHDPRFVALLAIDLVRRRGRRE